MLLFVWLWIDMERSYGDGERMSCCVIRKQDLGKQIVLSTFVEGCYTQNTQSTSPQHWSSQHKEERNWKGIKLILEVAAKEIMAVDTEVILTRGNKLPPSGYLRRLEGMLEIQWCTQEKWLPSKIQNCCEFMERNFFVSFMCTLPMGIGSSWVESTRCC